ncbi:MAG: hypothetical protein U9Q82_01225 [Chloroflexota bacterium]|nr:hypothetical protein [Chloroflexota bacterium]
MYKLIFDAGPLITVCKFSISERLVVDYLLERCEIAIATSVRNEVVLAGARYPDAQAAKSRIDDGQISILSPPSNPALESLIDVYDLGDGERDSILLGGDSDLHDATLVIDDHLAYLVSDRLKQLKRFLLDVIVDLVNNDELNKKLAIQIIHAIQTRYPRAFVEHTLRLLER